MKGRRAAALGLVLLAGGCRKAASRQEKKEALPPLPVRVEPARRAQVARRVKVRCTLRSRFRATLSPKVPGILLDVPLEAGDRVEKGKTLLFRSESDLEAAEVEAASAALQGALQGLEEARAALSAAAAAEEKARRDRDRLERLLRAGKAVTPDQVEKARVAWKAAAADLERARAAVGLARSRVEGARARKEAAATRLEDTEVYAPQDGVVVRKLAEEGEAGKPGRPVYVVEDPDRLEAAAFLEASLYGRVRPGKTQVRIFKGGKVLFQGALTWKSPTIRPDLRVFEVRVHLPRGFTGAASGELLPMELLLDPHEALTVPTEAVVIRGRKPTVFVVRRGRARLLTLETGVVDGERTEVLGGGLKEGDPVVVLGQAFLRDGREVRIDSAGKGR